MRNDAVLSIFIVDVVFLNMSGVLIASESSICLSPDLEEKSDRPVPMLVNKTSTTLSIRWDRPTLPTICDDVVFSFLRFTYRVRTELNMVELTIEVCVGYHLSIFKSIHLSIHPSINLSIHPFIHPSTIHPSTIHPFIHPLILFITF